MKSISKKNIKRTLALTLTMVMLLGMIPVFASAGALDGEISLSANSINLGAFDVGTQTAGNVVIANGASGAATTTDFTYSATTGWANFQWSVNNSTWTTFASGTGTITGSGSSANQTGFTLYIRAIAAPTANTQITTTITLAHTADDEFIGADAQVVVFGTVKGSTGNGGNGDDALPDPAEGSAAALRFTSANNAWTAPAAGYFSFGEKSIGEVGSNEGAINIPVFVRNAGGSPALGVRASLAGADPGAFAIGGNTWDIWGGSIGPLNAKDIIAFDTPDTGNTAANNIAIANGTGLFVFPSRNLTPGEYRATLHVSWLAGGQWREITADLYIKVLNAGFQVRTESGGGQINRGQHLNFRDVQFDDIARTPERSFQLFNTTDNNATDITVRLDDSNGHARFFAISLASGKSGTPGATLAKTISPIGGGAGKLIYVHLAPFVAGMGAGLRESAIIIEGPGFATIRIELRVNLKANGPDIRFNFNESNNQVFGTRGNVVYGPDVTLIRTHGRAIEFANHGNDTARGLRARLEGGDADSFTLTGPATTSGQDLDPRGEDGPVATGRSFVNIRPNSNVSLRLGDELRTTLVVGDVKLNILLRVVEAGQVDAIDEYMKTPYKGFFGRDPDNDGLFGWVDYILSGEWTLARVILEGFVFSAENANNWRRLSDTGKLEVLYAGFFGRDPDEQFDVWLSDYYNNPDSEYYRNWELVASKGFAQGDEFLGIVKDLSLKP